MTGAYDGRNQMFSGPVTFLHDLGVGLAWTTVRHGYLVTRVQKIKAGRSREMCPSSCYYYDFQGR